MKLKFISQDLPQKTWQNFAIKLGWTPTVMTTDLSPNVPVPNPKTFVAFITERYANPLWNDLAEFNSQSAVKQAEANKLKIENDLAIATAQAIAEAKQSIAVTIE